MEANKYDEARKTLQPLLAAEHGNAWYLDLATDIDLGQNKANEAINRLKMPAIYAPTLCCSSTGERLSTRRSTTRSGQYSESLHL